MTIEELPPIAERAAAPAHLPELPSDVGLTWRALTPEDVPALFALISVVEATDNSPERSTEHAVGEKFTGSWRRPALDLVAGFDAQGAIRAYAWSDLRPVEKGTLAPVLSGGVHPEYRRRGIGSALLAWSEARARQQLAGAAANLPARIRMFTFDRHEGERALAESAGFTASRWYVDMRRDLSVPIPDIALGEGIAIEVYTESRRDDVRVTHNEAFVPDHWGSNPYDAEAWGLHAVGSEKFRPDWSFVAVDTATGRVVGYLLSGAYDQDWTAQGFTEGWTDLLAVRREWRRRGIAPALLTSAMRAYAAGGMQYAGLDVDVDNPTGALGLYENLGYERRGVSIEYSRQL